METKQLIKTVIVYAVSFVLCVVAMCFAPTDKKDESEELVGKSQRLEQIITCSETVEEVLEVDGNEF